MGFSDKERSELFQLGKVCVPGRTAEYQVYKFSTPGGFYEAGRLQLLQMMGKCGWSDGEVRSEIGTGGAGLAGDSLQNLEAAWIGEHPRDDANLARRQFRFLV